MKYLGRVMGRTRRDQFRHRSIREELDQRPIEEEMKGKQFRWNGHFIHMRRDIQM